MTKRTTMDETGLAPGGRRLLDDAAMREWADELVARARAEGVKLTGDGGLLTGLGSPGAVAALMRAHIQSGDRSAAAHVYQEHISALNHADLGDPDDAVEQLRLDLAKPR